jgi:hypothetical protein
LKFYDEKDILPKTQFLILEALQHLHEENENSAKPHSGTNRRSPASAIAKENQVDSSFKRQLHECRNLQRPQDWAKARLPLIPSKCGACGLARKDGAFSKVEGRLNVHGCFKGCMSLHFQPEAQKQGKGG